MRRSSSSRAETESLEGEAIGAPAASRGLAAAAAVTTARWAAVSELASAIS